MRIVFDKFLQDGASRCPRYESMNNVLQKIEFVLNCLMFLVEDSLAVLHFSSFIEIDVRDSTAIVNELKTNPLYNSQSWKAISELLLRIRNKLRHCPCSMIDKYEFIGLLVSSSEIVDILRRQVDVTKLSITKTDFNKNFERAIAKIIDTLVLAEGQIEDEHHNVYDEIFGLVLKALNLKF